jgi:hypothetical protein
MNRSYGHDDLSKWTNQRRVCVPEFFDRYFQLSLPEGQVSESTIQEIISLMGNRDALAGIFSQLQEQGLFMKTLERLETEHSLDSLGDPMPYLLALSDIKNRISDNKPSGFSVSGYDLIRFAINRVLLNISDSKRKIEIVTELIENGSCVSLSAQLLWSVIDTKDGSPYPRMQDATLEPLKVRWLQRVRELAADGRLLEVSGLPLVFYGWMEWSDPKEAKEFVASMGQNLKRLLSFLYSHISRSTVQGIGSYHVHHRAWISWTKDLQRFMSKEDWGKAGDLLAKSGDLSNSERQTTNLLQYALKRWDRGIEDTYFTECDDFSPAQKTETIVDLPSEDS